MSLAKTIYLDHAATTPVDPFVLQAMLPYYSELFYNPSAQYTHARTVKSDLQQARINIAHHIGARPNEIVFTAGGTEANNLAIKGILENYPGRHVIVSAIEHESVLVPATSYDAKLAAVLASGRIDIDLLEADIDDQTVLISVQYVNNEIGTIQPLKDISTLINNILKDRGQRGVDLPLYFHTDACQASAYLDIHASRLGVDVMTINASKIYGPKQIGALYIKSGTMIAPQLLGGGQERGMRSGTENVPAIIGFAKALELVQARRHDESKRLQTLRSEFEHLLQSKIPTSQFNGSNKHRLANNVHVTLPGHDNETLMMQLDDLGIICAVGSACSASSEEPSHVLKAIGMSDIDAQSSLRFTMGIATQSADIVRVVDELAKLIGQDGQQSF